MKYEDIKNYAARCDSHPDHQTGIITHQMIMDRLHDEIEELRDYIEAKSKPLTEEQVIQMALDAISEGLAEAQVVYQISMKDGAASSAWIDVDEAAYNSAKLYGEYKCRCLYTTPPQRQPESEPVVWQFRMRPDWVLDKDFWEPWTNCTKEQAADYQRVPHLHDWTYESRSLFTHPIQRKPLTDQQKLDLVTNWFAEDWAIKKALGLLHDYDIKQAQGIGGKV